MSPLIYFSLFIRIYINFTFIYHRLLETVLIATVTTFSVFILATLLGTCVPAVETLGYQEFVDSTQNYFCPVKNLTTHIGSFHFTEYFNDMATLVFNSEEEAIKQLFHQDGNLTKLNSL